MSRCGSDRHSNAMWLAVCSCGTVIVRESQAFTGRSNMSYGCLRKENTVAMRNAKRRDWSDVLGISDGVVSSKTENGFLEFTAPCAYCGRSFVVKPKDLSRRYSAFCGRSAGDMRLYCSKSCKLACPSFRKVKNMVDLKRATQIGTSRECSVFLRKSVLARDGYSCTSCGKSEGVQLHVHHIVPLGIDPFLDGDADNLRTLCKTCHQSIHRMPGMRPMDISRYCCGVNKSTTEGRVL